ncbi:hypothetical protein DevBK_02045 [Devosia sp. BK]|uniref:hypothetical protein n=1 Tax=unclassified Devosia TaxID=196773 RepID=UPI00138EEE09|nr:MULTISPECIES: hypothetical protein [unclassified Devosia]MDV3250106.1 hypothetical protein [Devosia sp. BK]
MRERNHRMGFCQMLGSRETVNRDLGREIQDKSALSTWIMRRKRMRKALGCMAASKMNYRLLRWKRYPSISFQENDCRC